MSFITRFLPVLLAVWIVKTSSLPKLYHRLQDRRDVAVSQFRKLEKAGLKVTKLVLDLKYFESCLELGICPKYLKFKPPNLPAYQNTKNVLRKVLSNQINCVNKDLKQAKRQYQFELKSIVDRISIVEKMVLCHLLKKRYEAHSIPVLKTHRDKLLTLWKSERSRSPKCLMNLSKVKLSLLQENALRLGLKNHI